MFSLGNELRNGILTLIFLTFGFICMTYNYRFFADKTWDRQLGYYKKKFSRSDHQNNFKRLGIILIGVTVGVNVLLISWYVFLLLR